MIGALVGWFSSRAAKKLIGELASLYTRRQSAEDRVEIARLDAEIRLAETKLEARQEAVRAATEVRRGSGAMEFLTLVAGLPLALHLGAVCLDSALPGLFPGWTVHALPGPMAVWQGWLVAALFGVTGLLRAVGR